MILNIDLVGKLPEMMINKIYDKMPMDTFEGLTVFSKTLA
jgi:hypothetical protein